jgi:hypothetical protein
MTLPTNHHQTNKQTRKQKEEKESQSWTTQTHIENLEYRYVLSE